MCSWCADRVPYFAVPRYIEFRDELPRNPVGRVLKYQLRDEGRTPATWDREDARSEEHTSELQSLMRISYAFFCLKKKNKHQKSRHYSAPCMHNNCSKRRA